MNSNQESETLTVDLDVDVIVYILQDCMDRDISPRQWFQEIVGKYTEEVIQESRDNE